MYETSSLDSSLQINRTRTVDDATCLTNVPAWQAHSTSAKSDLNKELGFIKPPVLRTVANSLFETVEWLSQKRLTTTIKWNSFVRTHFVMITNRSTFKVPKKMFSLSRCKSKWGKMRIWRTPWALWSAENLFLPAGNRISIPWLPSRGQSLNRLCCPALISHHVIYKKKSSHELKRSLFQVIPNFVSNDVTLILGHIIITCQTCQITSQTSIK